MKLSVIIVNFNVRHFLEQCLLSVKRATENIEAEVLVVDNASSDGSVSMLHQNFPWVKLTASKENLGFSKANNAGIRLAQGEYILLLNPDTVVSEDTFQKCIAFMDSHRDAGALGVHMIDGKGNFLPESKRGLPTPSVSFYKMFGLASLFPKSKIFGKYHLGFLPANETHEVDVLSGAFMFIRKEALSKAGLLDEAFFMYGEDIDLSYRLTQSGFKNYYFHETNIIHYKGESTKKGSLNYVRVFYNAMLIFARKHYSGNQSGIMTLLINLAIFIRGLLTLLASLLSSSYLFVVDASLSFGGIYLIKNYWETMIKYSPDYYPAQFLFIVVPVYVLIWMIAVLLSGGYEKPYRISHILRGVFAGTIAIAALYAFLPEEWRFSRAIILLGAVWTAGEMLLTRTIYHLIKHQSLFFELDEEKRILIAGTQVECRRAEKLLLSTGAGHEVILARSPDAELKKLSALFEINEVVFCSSAISFREIIRQIILCGNHLDYKILNEESDVFIGSNSKNSPGEIYSGWHQYHLAQPLYLRKKRILDIVICLICILIFPLTFFWIKTPLSFFRNWKDVLLGIKTWVGYSRSLKLELPIIPPGVISVVPSYDGQMLDDSITDTMNLLYAKHYSAFTDIKLIVKNRTKLGHKRID